MRTFMTALAVATVAIATTACATKKYVQTSVGEVNDKVDSLGRSVEQTQERVKANEGKISEVDSKATAAGNAAQQANAAAANAANAAGAANNAATTVGTKLDAFDKSMRRLVLEVAINTSSGNFQFGKTDLPEDTKSQIDQLISKLTQDPKNVYFEIEGHTDNVGSGDFNEKLGLERAEAAKLYLYEKHQIPLHKMNVISYGMTKPVADNKTKDGRAQNRRIVIRVLE
ncbi:MAG TPA: OmpA family protein [Vicinamibacterales bacterium]|nr:OmpA family protein [Vicinamibacterales bacterium]